MSGRSRRSIFSPGKSGIGTKRPPWTVLHRWRSITLLLIFAAAGEAMAPATSTARESARRTRIGRLGVKPGASATDPQHRQVRAVTEIVVVHDRDARPPGRDAGPAEGLVDGGLREDRQSRPDRGGATLRDGRPPLGGAGPRRCL